MPLNVAAFGPRPTVGMPPVILPVGVVMPPAGVVVLNPVPGVVVGVVGLAVLDPRG